ncbi:TPA: hypothetical protein ACYSEN_005446, partial [Klebsiella pneumoniae]
NSTGVPQPQTQYVPLNQRHYLQYVVLFPCPETSHSAPENATLLISSQWYTSGNFDKTEKSDPAGTTFR